MGVARKAASERRAGVVVVLDEVEEVAVEGLDEDRSAGRAPAQIAVPWEMATGLDAEEVVGVLVGLGIAAKEVDLAASAVEVAADLVAVWVAAAVAELV